MVREAVSGFVLLPAGGRRGCTGQADEVFFLALPPCCGMQSHIIIYKDQEEHSSSYFLGHPFFKDVPLVEFMYFVFTRMPGDSHRRRLRSLLLYLC